MGKVFNSLVRYLKKFKTESLSLCFFILPLGGAASRAR